MKHWTWIGLIIGMGGLMLTPQSATHAQTRYANANAWPLDDPYRHIIAYPDTAWTWELLGLTEGSRCPYYYRRGFDDSQESWRDETLPVDEDWNQATRGNRQVACYRLHRGTDISADPGAPVYATAQGTILEVEYNVDENGVTSNAITVAHSRILDGDLYEWIARYVHLDDRLVRREGSVVEGEVIGFVADNGDNTHLHFEIVRMFNCAESCIVNPWGYTYLWVDDDFDGWPDPADSYLPPAVPDENLFENRSLALEADGFRRAYAPYLIEPDTAYTLTLVLNNPTHTYQIMEIILRDVGQDEGLDCTLAVRPGESQIVLHGVTSETWGNIMLQLSDEQTLKIVGVGLQVGTEADGDGCAH